MTHQKKPAQRRAPDVSGDLDPQPSGADAGRQRGGKTGTANGTVSPILARQIDENLKRLYNQHVEEDLPPALQDLVARLRQGQAKSDRDDEGTT